MKYLDNDMTEEIRNKNNNYIQTRWFQLYTLSKESRDDATKYLLAVNAGGAVATLAYLGNNANSATGIKTSLVFFFIDLIFVGVLKAYNLHKLENLFIHYQDQVQKYHDNQIGWNNLIKSDKEKVGKSLVGYVFGYISFVCFILGSIVGACTLI